MSFIGASRSKSSCTSIKPRHYHCISTAFKLFRCKHNKEHRQEYGDSNRTAINGVLPCRPQVESIVIRIAKFGEVKLRRTVIIFRAQSEWQPRARLAENDRLVACQHTPRSRDAPIGNEGRGHARTQQKHEASGWKHCEWGVLRSAREQQEEGHVGVRRQVAHAPLTHPRRGKRSSSVE